MKNKRLERGLCELYANDPERADALVFGRVANKDRRGFLKGAGLAGMSALLGAAIPFHRHMPAGLIPAALAEEAQPLVIEGKSELTVLGDRPINAETPAHLLDDNITPNRLHFVRNNGLISDRAEKMDATGWLLTIDGEVEKPLTLSLDDLKSQFEVVKFQLQLECGGNGRSGFNPPAKGNQWTLGAVGNAEWTGVRLKDVLAAAGLKKNAVYTAHFGADKHLSGDPSKLPISRGMPIEKALNPHTLIAFEMNHEPIPALHGFPVRILASGWPGSVSHKWLTRIQVRDQIHDGPKMTGYSYRVPAYSPAPGAEVAKEDMKIIQSMPVKSLITSPKTNIEIPFSNPSIEVRGHAWAGDRVVKEVYVTQDYGSTWIKADLSPPPNPYAWQRWHATLSFPTHGYYEIWARAVDDQGRMQPFTTPGWNPKGYLNNAMHRIAVTVVA